MSSTNYISLKVWAKNMRVRYTSTWKCIIHGKIWYFTCIEYLWKDTQKTGNSGYFWEKELSGSGAEVGEKTNVLPFYTF